MKNFPHQHNQFSKLRATLEAIRDLEAAGKDSSDDGVLGDELARRQIHRFRDLDYSDTADLDQKVEQQLVKEHKKSPSSQGTRTAARENRKTLRHLGWLESHSSNLTTAGEALLASTPGSAEELAIIRPAVTQIAVTDSDGDTSHPVKILLRLVDAGHFDSHDGMELALEAKDDSEAEYQRVDKLGQLSSDDRREQLEKSGATDNKIANAKKILPAFAENAGLIFQSGDGTFELTEVGRDAIQAGPTPKAGGSRGGTKRRRSSKRRFGFQRGSMVGSRSQLGRPA